MRIAVVGASGFVGTRLLEQFILGQIAEVVPVVRSFASLAVISRFDLPWKVCDVMNTDDLAKAFSDCDAVVHLALGDAKQIVKMADSVYAAAEKAGVRRVVALSSAAVHGLNPTPGTDESSPISDSQTMEYNNAKVRAEQVFLRARQRGNVELVILRPSIVYGPRCKLFTRVVENLIAGTAFLINDGEGICNAIYVDNLIRAIRLALERSDVDGETFLIGDAETITWRSIYNRFTEALGIQMNSVHHVTPPLFRKSLKERVDSVVATSFAQSLLRVVPGHAKRLTKVVLSAMEEEAKPDAWALVSPLRAIIDEELATLQQCKWKYPNEKAIKRLGYEPHVSFPEGLRRMLSWLEFAGYPVRLDSISLSYAV
jgi:nucleoside-diphosphate-sugar epimerase